MLPELVKGEWAPKEKMAHASVGYEHPSKHEDEHCSLCEYYIPAQVPRCRHVANPVRAGDYCQRYEEKE